MNEKLKMKPSVFLVCSRIVATLLTILVIGTTAFGVCDFRSEEQQIADFKAELLTNSFSQAALNGLRYFHNGNLDTAPESISVFSKSDIIYVVFSLRNDEGKLTEYYYNATNGRSIKKSDYAYARLNATSDIRRFRNIEIRVLCEEVGINGIDSM